MPRSKSSHRWLQEHFNDDYVKRAKALGYRSRAAFKLLEIQDKDNLIQPGMAVVDLGAAPGGWSQIAAKLVGEKGRVYALDLLPMDSLAGVEVMCGDFTQDDVLAQLKNKLDNRQLDLVISDMAPNMSGNKSVDIPRAMCLVEYALQFAIETLAPGGCFLTKIFHGQGFDELVKQARQHFAKVVMRKPKASRSRSRESYLLAKGFKL